MLADGFDNPEEAADVGGSIVDYDLPAGYDEQGAMNRVRFSHGLHCWSR
jgi:hypothetical protein